MVAAPRPADAPQNNSPATTDPLFRVLDQLKAPDKDEATDRADIVDLGDGPDYVPPMLTTGGSGKWIVAPEEKGPVGAAPHPIPPSAGEDDPELPRHGKDQDEPEDDAPVAKPLARPRHFISHPDDPESAWRRIGPTADNETGEPGGDRVMPGAAVHPVASMEKEELQRPRFPSGEGLDSEAAELVGALAVEAEQNHETDPNAPRRTGSSGSVRKTRGWRARRGAVACASPGEIA